MKKRLIIACLLVPTMASAGPITTSTWSAMSAATNSGVPFYDGLSWDGEFAGIAWLLSGQEFLSDGSGNAAAFTVPGFLTLTNLGGNSAYLADHSFSHDMETGEFCLDNGHGYIASSLGAGVLLTRMVSAGWTDYQVWFEDLPLEASDKDYQDRGYAFRLSSGTPTQTTTEPVPEPATLLLFGAGLVCIARRARVSAFNRWRRIPASVGAVDPHVDNRKSRLRA